MFNLGFGNVVVIDVGVFVFDLVYEIQMVEFNASRDSRTQAFVDIRYHERKQIGRVIFPFQIQISTEIMSCDDHLKRLLSLSSYFWYLYYFCLFDVPFFYPIFL